MESRPWVIQSQTPPLIETPKAKLEEGLAFGAHGHLISPQGLEVQHNPSDPETFQRSQLSPILTAHHSMATTFPCPSITSSSLYALHSPALGTSGSLVPCMVPSLTHSSPLLVFFSHPEMPYLTLQAVPQKIWLLFPWNLHSKSFVFSIDLMTSDYMADSLLDDRGPRGMKRVPDLKLLTFYWERWAEKWIIATQGEKRLCLGPQPRAHAQGLAGVSLLFMTN